MKNCKRKRVSKDSNEEEKEEAASVLNTPFLTRCEKDFKSDPTNILIKNTVNSVGSELGGVNAQRVNKISHVFLNSVKSKRARATNQGRSGRCWMFAALNTFRHLLMNALNLENFEFSEVYLFFWDKLERANTYLKWFVDHEDAKPGDRGYDYMLCDYLSDGGWFNTFANLVNKYGVVPQSAMKETFQSDDSEDMNRIIKEQLDTCVNHMRKNRNKLSVEALHDLRKSTVQHVYNTLVKFLGEPPKRFEWSFFDADEAPMTITKLTPKRFLDMVAPDMDLHRSFVVLSHIPMQGIEYHKKYRIRHTNNVEEGEVCTVFNVPIDQLARYTMKSISKGCAVWFVGDVQQSFYWMHGALDDQLDAQHLLFGKTVKTAFDKGDRILLRNVQGNHAMAFTGFNVDDAGNPVSWQVENSWGYGDYETPGKDGFLCMSHTWFEKYVTQVSVMRSLLSRSLTRQLNTAETVELNPWDCMAPALRVNTVRGPLSSNKQRKIATTTRS